MTGTASDDKLADTRIMLSLLESVERDGAQTQRRLASELGVALGLVNAYLKRCVKKGLVKVSEAPARRYMYYLTPHGFSEKSRLTVEYLTHSFEFFRQAKSDCAAVIKEASERGRGRMVLAGCSDLAEVALICANDMGVEVAAVVDPKLAGGALAGISIVQSFALVEAPVSAVIVTDLVSAERTIAAAISAYGAERVFVPLVLRRAVTTYQG